MKKILIINFFVVFFILKSFSQEYLTNLSSNPVIKKNIKEKTGFYNNSKSQEKILLPFFDDFSDSDIFPNVLKWSDNDAFINNDYCLYPPSIGVATLDAIDYSGSVYSFANVFPFEADNLTSNEIRLDSVFQPSAKKLSGADSLYFSFYYQPQGFGDAPESGDSLFLEFYSEPNWYKVWSAEGMPIDTFYKRNNCYFKRVMIPILDSIEYPGKVNFFKNNFKFRFSNYASISTLPSWKSNSDHWNIDYVYLNYNRNINDTIFNDICFVKNAPSFLKKYQAMPYSQYCEDPLHEMQDTLDIFISNLDNETHNYSYNYKVFNESDEIINEYSGGEYNIGSFYSFGYQTWQPHARPPVRYILPFGFADSACFKITHILNCEPGLSVFSNDTISFYQKFYNYYAYDDGTAEAGYGLKPAGSQLAYKFSVNKKDTLRAVKMFFNHTLNFANQQYFYLRVWTDNGGKPGETVYEQRIEPVFEDSLNKFHTFKLTTPVCVKNVFYVGWQQTTDDNLNIGFDKNNDSHSKIFYNTDGQWKNTMYSGSLMIRPVLGKDFSMAGVNNLNKQPFDCRVFPNPVTNGILNIYLSDSENSKDDYNIQIFNLLGQKIFTAGYKNKVDVSEFKNGLYFLKITNTKTNISSTKRIIISK